MFYPLLCASFCNKNGNLAHNHRILLQMKHKARDKTLEQCFLKEFKATCKNSGKSELKNKKKQHSKSHCRLVYNALSKLFNC